MIGYTERCIRRTCPSLPQPRALLLYTTAATIAIAHGDLSGPMIMSMATTSPTTRRGNCSLKSCSSMPVANGIAMRRTVGVLLLFCTSRKGGHSYPHFQSLGPCPSGMAASSHPRRARSTSSSWRCNEQVSAHHSSRNLLTKCSPFSTSSSRWKPSSPACTGTPSNCSVTARSCAGSSASGSSSHPPHPTRARGTPRRPSSRAG